MPLVFLLDEACCCREMRQINVTARSRHGCDALHNRGGKIAPMSPLSYPQRVLVTLALVAVALLVWKLAPVLILAFAGIVFAAALRAASVPLSRRLALSNTVSVTIVLVLVVAIAVAGGYAFGAKISDEADAVWVAITEAPAKVRQFLQGSRFGVSVVDSLRGATSPETLAKLARGTFTVFGALADVGLVLFLAVYFAADPHTYRRGALALVPASVREKVSDALDASGAMLRKWLIGQLGAMATVGILIGVGLALLGMPLALPLGVLSGLLEFVPVVGPLIALVLGVLVAFGQGPEMALYVGLLYGAVLFVEGNIIIPLAQKWAVALPPALGLLGIAIFGVLFGLVGVLFAMPLLVVAVTLVQRLYVPAISGAPSSSG
jgi:predicted PurR-regulated permease PerM